MPNGINNVEKKIVQKIYLLIRKNLSIISSVCRMTEMSVDYSGCIDGIFDKFQIWSICYKDKIFFRFYRRLIQTVWSSFGVDCWSSMADMNTFNLFSGNIFVVSSM